MAIYKMHTIYDSDLYTISVRHADNLHLVLL